MDRATNEPEATVTFHVNIPALRGLPEFLDQRDSDLRASLAYLAAHAVIRDVSPLYHRMYVRHRANVAAVERLLAGAASYVSADASRVRSAADAYQNADRDATLRNVARTDNALPDFPTDQSDPPPSFDNRPGAVTAAVFADSGPPPTDDLTPIQDRSGWLPYQPSWTDLLSPASYIRDAIWLATRLAASVGLLNHADDPIQLLLTPFVGDWPGLLHSADAFGNIANLLADEATSIGSAHRRVPVVWTGHASDACQCSLDRLAEALIAAAADIAALSSAYQDAGIVLHSIMTAAAGAFGAMVDTVLSIDEDALSAGLLIPITIPGVIIDYVQLVSTFRQLAADVSKVIDTGFPPGDPLTSVIGKGSELVLPDMNGLAGQAEIPLVGAAATGRSNATGVRRVA
jgi:hypothetical protein